MFYYQVTFSIFAKLDLIDLNLTIYDALMCSRQHPPLSPCPLANLSPKLKLAEREGLIALASGLRPDSSNRLFAFGSPNPGSHPSLGSCVKFWRRERDSNPRMPCGTA